MKQVELIRQRIIRGQSMELQRLRAFISMTDGNVEVLPKLEGEAAKRLLARVTEVILTELGHVTPAVTAEHGSSKARRAVAKVLGAPKGE